MVTIQVFDDLLNSFIYDLKFRISTRSKTVSSTFETTITTTQQVLRFYSTSDETWIFLIKHK
jgi:hypothetical protein